MPSRGRVALLLVVMLLVPRWLTAAPRQYEVKGMVVSLDRAARRFVASIDAIPNYMAAMTMPFEVRSAAELEGLAPGVFVQFTLVVDERSSYATGIRIVRFQSVEQDPFLASRLRLLQDIIGSPGSKPIGVGDLVPDFTLTDQQRRPLTLSRLRGMVVAINFVYTSCVLPNFCLRLANNFNVLQKRFSRQLGRDLVLLTITFDPVHDTPEVLATYAAQWNADPRTWKFLTGTSEDVRRACQLFGVHAFANEGLMDHTLHTVMIDRQGKLAANVEGNHVTAAQLTDLIETMLKR